MKKQQHANKDKRVDPQMNNVISTQAAVALNMTRPLDIQGNLITLAKYTCHAPSLASAPGAWRQATTSGTAPPKVQLLLSANLPLSDNLPLLTPTPLAGQKVEPKVPQGAKHKHMHKVKGKHL